MESPTNRLKKELEEELKLSTDDLQSHAWYHGPLPGKVAESLVQEDGEFLIRDSHSSPGDYVLTCRCRHEAVHFRIIRVVLRPRKGYTRTRFQFEEEQFDNIPALVRFYVGNRNPVSESSGAVICHPVARYVPIRLLLEKYGGRPTVPAQTLGAPKSTIDPSRRRSVRALSTADMDDSNLLRIKDKCGSHPVNLDSVGRRPSLHTAQSDSNLLTGTSEPTFSPTDRSGPPPSPLFRTGSDPVLRANATSQSSKSDSTDGVSQWGSDGQLHSKAPPKPIRAPSLLLPDPPQDEGMEATYSELVPRAPAAPRSHVDRLLAEEKWKARARATETTFGFLDSVALPPPLSPCVEEETPQAEAETFVRPEIQNTSSFHPKNFQSLLLVPDNKPLDAGALKRLKALFLESDSRTTALHMLQVDCQVARIRGVSQEQQRKMGVSSGLELITLPHGSQLRKDLLERHHLIALGIAVDILGCTGALTERAGTLHRIIQLAAELKETAGDLFAFSAVMKALEFPQVVRLQQTWQALRQTHTSSAITFEKQLKPYLKALNESKENAPVVGGGLAIPHILPLLKLMEGADTLEHTEESCELLLRVLASARSIAMNVGAYHENAEAKLRGFQHCPELLEAFHSEFALRLFWGSKGAEVAQAERYKKFNQILNVLSQKLEPEKKPER
ncbi:breast cancer anti-estrogen resistance protein 3 homolog [Ambystoma mexicanum]|uniref:breast cancer anti-estrogen resistance protein 3 homolog n=1 Tax=Ambystoma mexicanum TaxID=8296 RepID=UPI0037E87CC0